MSYGQPPSGYGYGPQQYPPQGHPPGYGPHGQPIGPRDHPYAIIALGLGLAAVFLLGALLGVPAILVGRSGLKAIRLEPHRWQGGTTATLGIVLGWISVAETAVIAGVMLTRNVALGVAWIGLSLVGLTFLGLSVAAQRLPKPVAMVSSTLRKAPLAVCLCFGGVLAGSSFGIHLVLEKQLQQTQRCALVRAQYDDAIKKDSFEAARSAIDDIKSICQAPDAETVPMRGNVDAKQADAQTRKENAEKAALAQTLADKEKTAVNAFPEQSKQIAAKIKKAQSLAWQGKWQDADEMLTTSQEMLDEFKETSLEQSKGFADLTTQIVAQRKAIQPQIDKMEAKRRQDEAAAALRAAIRGPKPVNSAWDGSVSAIERAVKANMHDQSSYEHVRTTVPVVEGDYWTVLSSFRGKNVFGAKVLNTKKFYIQLGQVVKMTDVGGDDE